MSGTRQPCGTNAAYVRHIAAGEETDQACKDAHAQYANDHRTAAAAGTVRRAALDLLASEYPARFREIYTGLVLGQPDGGAQ